jgi:hypothetical protein
VAGEGGGAAAFGDAIWWSRLHASCQSSLNGVCYMTGRQPGEETRMSVVDQVRALEREVLQRLRELRPLVAEYRDLEKVAARLGLKRDDDGAIETAAPGPSAQGKPAAKRRAKRSAGGQGSRRAAAAKPRATPAAARKSAAKAKPKPVAAAKPAAGSKPPARRPRTTSKPTARKRTAVAPGQRERDVLRLVGERPGVTVAELAAELGVDATGLYGVVRRLQGKGQISKDGTRLRLSVAVTAPGDDALDVAPEPPAGPADTLARTGEDLAPAAARPAGASAAADESS